jgi:hypothetical protein
MIQLNTQKQDPYPVHTHLPPEPGKKFVRDVEQRRTQSLTSETVKSAALSLESIDNIERSDGLALGVFCVCNCIADDTLKEGLENASGFLVDHCSTR